MYINYVNILSASLTPHTANIFISEHEAQFEDATSENLTDTQEASCKRVTGYVWDPPLK